VKDIAKHKAKINTATGKYEQMTTFFNTDS